MTDDETDELDEAILNAPCCFWFGLPPCPKCKGDHGDPKCTPEHDANLRALLASHLTPPSP